MPRVRRRTAYPRPCCTCTLSPGSLRTFTFTLPALWKKRGLSLLAFSTLVVSVFLFSLNCVQRTFLFSSERETGQCSEPPASIKLFGTSMWMIFRHFCSRNHATTCFPAICVFGPLGIRYSFPFPTFFHIAYFKYSAWTGFCHK